MPASARRGPPWAAIRSASSSTEPAIATGVTLAPATSSPAFTACPSTRVKTPTAGSWLSASTASLSTRPRALGDTRPLARTRPLQPGAGPGDGPTQAPGSLVLVHVPLVQLDHVNLGDRSERLKVLLAQDGAFAKTRPEIVGEHAPRDGARCELGPSEAQRSHRAPVRCSPVCASTTRSTGARRSSGPSSQAA